VIIIGTQGKESITAEEVALKAGTINYEIVTRINPLIPRIILSDAKKNK
jgi:alanine racemase